jgi:hypothetical protein
MHKETTGNAETAIPEADYQAEQASTSVVKHADHVVPEYFPHPLANLFPPMDEATFNELVKDIKANGLHEAITLSKDGLILDGLNRYRACKKANITPKFVTYQGTDELGFVLSKNLTRRHLTESQRAMIAATLATMKKGDNQHTKEVTPIEVTSQADAAKLLNVSVNSVQRAKAVQCSGNEELIQKVKSGEMAVSKAAELAKPSKIKIIVKKATPEFAENAPPPDNIAHVENYPEAGENDAQGEPNGVKGEHEDHLPASVGTPLSTWQKKMRLNWSQTSQKERDLFETFIFDFKKAALVRLAEKC